MIDDERTDLLTPTDGYDRAIPTHIRTSIALSTAHDYRSALASLGAISGRVPMTRKYIHGVWYCRYWDYTSDEFLILSVDMTERFPA